MEVDPGRRRTGGRSARVRAAVHEAVTALLTEQGPRNVTVAEVAARRDRQHRQRWCRV